MQISVVIPTYNRASTLKRAIDSVLEQSFAAHELIVVDDGSTDNTAGLLDSFKNISSLKRIRQSNQGVSSARNNGIKTASGEWIALLDSDDEWLPEKLEKQRQALEQQPSLRICHSDEIWIRNGRRVNAMKKHSKAGGNIYLNCLPLCAISPSAVMIHQDIFSEIGLFDTSLPACEDYDLWLRICADNPVLFIDEPLLKKYGGHADQLSRLHPAMDRFRIYAMEKILRTDRLSTHQRAATLREIKLKFGVFSNGALKRGKQTEVAELEARIADLLKQAAAIPAETQSNQNSTTDNPSNGSPTGEPS